MLCSLRAFIPLLVLLSEAVLEVLFQKCLYKVWRQNAVQAAVNLLLAPSHRSGAVCPHPPGPSPLWLPALSFDLSWSFWTDWSTNAATMTQLKTGNKTATLGCLVAFSLHSCSSLETMAPTTSHGCGRNNRLKTTRFTKLVSVSVCSKTAPCVLTAGPEVCERHQQCKITL